MIKLFHNQSTFFNLITKLMSQNCSTRRGTRPWMLKFYLWEVMSRTIRNSNEISLIISFIKKF